MADRLDVAERLVEGRLAVERTQRYVRACQLLGYQHPDLTAHPAQVTHCGLRAGQAGVASDGCVLSVISVAASA